MKVVILSIGYRDFAFKSTGKAAQVFTALQEALVVEKVSYDNIPKYEPRDAMPLEMSSGILIHPNAEPEIKPARPARKLLQ